MSFQALYLPIGAPSYDLKSAQIKFEDSIEMLSQISHDIAFPDEMLLSIEKIRGFLADKHPDLLIVQNITFANSNYIQEIMSLSDAHILLWTLPEPVVDGTGLRLNSLSGAFSAGNAMSNYGRSFSYVYGSTYADETKQKIKAIISAARLRHAMSGLRLLQIGQAPEGYGFGNATDTELKRWFGVKLCGIDARELMEKARAYDDDDIRDFIYEADHMIVNLLQFERENIFGAGRIFKAYFDYCQANHIGAIASKCWPDYFKEYGTPICAVLSILNDLGIPSACEADICGALSVYISQFLSNMPSYFGEPVSISEEQNTITFWNCGMAPTTIAREDSRAQAGNHFIYDMAPVMDFGCRASRHATIFRVGRGRDGGFRFFVSTGEAPERLKQFKGTSIVVQPDCKVLDMVERAVQDGWEQHFAVALADISAELEALGKMLGIEVVRF